MEAKVQERAPEPARPPTDGERGAGGLGLALYAAAAFALLAALVHLWATPEHFVAWWAYGAFFLVASLAQGLYAVALLRWPGRQFLCFSGVWVNLALILVYVVTLTSRLPFSPHAGEVEYAGVLDVTAAAAELGLILVLVSLLGEVYRRATINALLLAGAAIWALGLAGVLS